MLFQQPEEFKFGSIQELIEYLNDIFVNSPLYAQEIEVIGDITHARYSKTGDLYIELSQQVGNSNYSITIYFNRTLVSYVLQHCQVENEKELVNKRWRFQGKVSFWKRDARYTIIGDSIIPIGDSEIEKKRKEILKVLEKHKLLRTIEHDLIELEPIKKIAVISSPTAAGFGDFQKNISHARYIPIVHLYEAPMQGADTVPGIKRALLAISKSKINYDVVVIIRGGGSKSDLMYFDDLELGYLIAKFNEKVPVLTGIGHEQDSTIPDYVSWKKYSTPTEVSRDIVNQINTYTDNIETFEKTLILTFNSISSKTEALLSYNTLNNIKYYLGKEIATNSKKINDTYQKINNLVNIIFENSEKEANISKISEIQRFLDYYIRSYIQNLESKRSAITSQIGRAHV